MIIAGTGPVRRKIEKDINKSEEAAETLVKVGGKRQVPCLFIDGKPLYESMDIIKWLEEHPIRTDQK